MIQKLERADETKAMMKRI